MNCRVHTKSGAMYTINADEMTWHRRTPASGVPVYGITEDHGELSDSKVIVRLGDRLVVPIVMREDGITFNTYILTTPVVAAEVI